MTDLIRRADAIDAVRSRLYQSAMNNDGEARGTFADIAENRIELWLNEVPSADAVKYESTVTLNSPISISAEAETVDCTDFIRWLTETVMDDGMWELNAVAYGEVIARKLTKLGVLEVKDDVYVYEPSAEAVQGWIPCNERLPSKSGDYLCTIPLYADETYTQVLTFHKGRFYEDDDVWGATYHDDVLAWMPLPTPYKGGDSE